MLNTSAPANTIIMGEHSVVFGHPAIACAIDQRLHIHWQKRADTRIVITSALANHQTDLATLADHPQLNWVMACLAHYQHKTKNGIPFGLNITITSEFKSTLGLGSSAALLSAMLGGLNYICKQDATTIHLFKTGLAIIHQIQGSGSGTDLAASLTGGFIHFDPSQPTITKLDNTLSQHLPFQLIYCGYKTPTAKVLARVSQQWKNQPALLSKLYQLMGNTTQQAFSALINKDPNTFYQLANSYHGLMDALGVNDATLSHLIYSLRQQPGTLASKISGSGLGDCVLRFGSPLCAEHQNKVGDFDFFDINVTTQGLSVAPTPLPQRDSKI